MGFLGISHQNSETYPDFFGCLPTTSVVCDVSTSEEDMTNGSKKAVRSTTVLAVRVGDQTVVAADGQVTFGNHVLKSGAKKIRRLYNNSILAGFAGSTADAFALFERLESKLQAYGGNLLRSSVELAKEWRMDRALRRLDAMLVVADGNHILLLSGTGDVVDPDEDVIAIGSGGPYALAAARALVAHTDLDARSLAEEAMKVASELCIYTNEHVTFESIDQSAGQANESE